MGRLRRAAGDNECLGAVGAAAEFLAGECREGRDPTGAYARALALADGVSGDRLQDRRRALLSVLTCGRWPVAEVARMVTVEALDALRERVADARSASTRGDVMGSADALGDALANAVIARLRPPGLHAEALGELDRRWRKGRDATAAASGLSAALEVLDRPENDKPAAALDAAVERLADATALLRELTDCDITRLRGAVQGVVDARLDPTGRAALALAALDGTGSVDARLAEACRLLAPPAAAPLSAAGPAMDGHEVALRLTSAIRRLRAAGPEELDGAMADARACMSAAAATGIDPTGAYADALRSGAAASDPERARAAIVGSLAARGALPASSVPATARGRRVEADVELIDAVREATGAAGYLGAANARGRLLDALRGVVMCHTDPAPVEAHLGALAALRACSDPSDGILAALAALHGAGFVSDPVTEAPAPATTGGPGPKVRLVRASMVTGRMLAADAEAADALSALGYRHRSTVVTQDGLWAVVTMALGD